MNGNIRRAVALIDYENIGTLNNVPLSSYEEIIIFTGAMQTELRLPAAKLVRDIRIRQVATVSKNNVDFHLVLELGRLSVTAPETDFHIISYDKGYDGIVSSLNQSGHPCQRREPVKKLTTDGKKTENREILKIQKWTDKLQSLSQRSVAKMPKSVKSLDNNLKSLLRDEWSASLAIALKNELVKRRMITITKTIVIWKNK